MNKKMPIVLVILTLLLPMTASVVTAYDQGNPASYSVSIIVGTSSTFTVTLTPGLTPPETTLRFNGQQGQVDINATGQTTARPWARINNTGAGARNFSMGINAAPPTGVTLKAKNAPDMSGGSITLGTAILEIPGGHLLPGGGISSSVLDVWVKADYGSSAVIGTHTNNVAIRNYIPVLQSITVSGPVSLSYNQVATYTASGIDQEGNTIPLGTVAWSATAGSITSGGVYTAPGTDSTVTITATSAGKTGTIIVSVAY